MAFVFLGLTLLLTLMCQKLSREPNVPILLLVYIIVGIEFTFSAIGVIGLMRFIPTSLVGFMLATRL
jgi:hypothetical protein